MLRVVAVLAIGMVALFGILFAAARAGSDDGELRAFLLSDGCNAPCWQGIQPGITTVDEAVALLQAHPWVSSAGAGGTPADTRVYWRWNEQAPAFAGTITALYPESYLYARNGIIRYIRLTTRIPYGNIRLVMGAPETGSFQPSTPSSFNRLYFHTAGYFGGRVAFDTNLICPATPPGFWNDPVVIVYNDGSYPTYSEMPAYNLIPWIYQSNCVT